LPNNAALRPARSSLRRIQHHLDRYGISLRDQVWQTDNGREFKGDFPKALGDSQHVRIPPAAYTYQSDVETVHQLKEDKFFDLEDFTSRGDFLAKAHTYQLYFKLVRLAQRPSESLAGHRAARSPLAPSTLLATTRILGLLPQRLRGLRYARASLVRHDARVARFTFLLQHSKHALFVARGALRKKLQGSVIDLCPGKRRP